MSDCTPGENLKSVPEGLKENVFFVIDYDTNKSNRTFIDDCGSCIKSYLKSNFYLKSDTGDFENVHKKQDKYFRREKRKLVLAEPQPNSDSIIGIIPNIRKIKIIKDELAAWLEKFPGRDNLHQVALFRSILDRFVSR